MGKTHRFDVKVVWTGDRGVGTRSYREYSRDHEIAATGKPNVPGSSDAAYRGDAARWNPEELLVASVSACHKLWYLHLCADAGVTVRAYEDAAYGLMAEDDDGGGRFAVIVLRPKVQLASGADAQHAARLHHAAHEKCYIANSVKFPVTIEACFETGD